MMKKIFFIFLVGILQGVFSQNCAEAPTPALKIVCEQIHRWDKNARATPPVTTKIALPPAIPGQKGPMIAAELAPIASSPAQCMDLGCMCQYLGGNGQQGTNFCTQANGQPLRKALRKEYRMLSDDERARFHAAIRQLKNNGEYDRIAVVHSQFAESGGAHSGPAFLPWHREFIKRFEISLRLVDPSVALPYWDSSLDSVLPNSRDSIMWSDELMGRTDAQGQVATGFLTNWRTLAGRPNIRRSIGAQGSLFTENEIASVMRQTQIEDVLAYTAPQQGCQRRTDWNVLEYTHGNIHIYVGGDMLDQSTSANDPIFFLHHSFVDFIWELWRQQRQSRNERENAFPLDMQQCSSANHFGAALMRPFEPWRNTDGLSNKYTDNMFEYAPRPTCGGGRDCGSKFLFCDLSHGGPRCASKIRIGAQCSAWVSGENPCYNGVCQGGTCVAAAIPVTRPPPVPTTRPPIVQQPVTQNCFNEQECCAHWAIAGECTRNPGYMNAWCKASCSKCKINYDIRLECGNRHPSCAKWSAAGECSKNPYWMAENCRKSCNRCGTTRAQICGGHAQSQATTPAPVRPTKCDSPGCFNENICCQFWGVQGQCSRNATWMACNCRVSCGFCIPQDYYYGNCDDYHKDCAAWSTRGECQKNPWMLENCKSSCRSCFSSSELRQRCGGGGRRFGRETEFNNVLFDMQDGSGPPGGQGFM